MASHAVIVHGLNGSSAENWFPWLKVKLQALGYNVWVPDMPHADHPVGSEWVTYLLESGWDFNDTLLVGHSAGAVTALLLAQALPKNVRLHGMVMVSAFEPMQPGDELYPKLTDLHDQPFNFAKIKAASNTRIFIHSDNDPYCPLKGAKNLATATNSELVVIADGRHFSTEDSPSYSKFPRLLKILQDHNLLQKI